MLSLYVRYSPSALFFSSEHDKTISFAGAVGLINRKYLQSTTISLTISVTVMLTAQITEKDTIDLICRRFVLIDRLSDLIADSQAHR